MWLSDLLSQFTEGPLHLMLALFGFPANGNGVADIMNMYTVTGPGRAENVYTFLAHGSMARRAITGIAAIGDSVLIILYGIYCTGFFVFLYNERYDR